MWCAKPELQTPLIGFIIVIACIYLGVYALGYYIGATRSFKWVASISGGLLFVLFGMASGEHQIGGFGLLFILSIPILGWTIPFTIGGVVRRLLYAFLPRLPVAIKISIAGIAAFALLALAFHELNKSFPIYSKACVTGGFNGSVETRGYL